MVLLDELVGMELFSVVKTCNISPFRINSKLKYLYIADIPLRILPCHALQLI